jgi:tRNA modification GTPase
VVVLNKEDLGHAVEPKDPLFAACEHPRLRVSAKTGTGLDELRKTLRKIAEQEAHISDPDHVASLNQRCLLLMEEAAKPIKRLMENARAGRVPSLEIVSLEVRRSLSPLAEITGERVGEGVLERIFEQFCVGK